MANTRSARKRIRSSETKRVHNRGVRSSVRTKVAKARRGLLAAADAGGVEEDLRAAVRALDRAAEKGILHRNNARRRKSRLTAMAARLARAAAGAESDQVAARSAAAGGAKGRTARGTKTAAKAPARKPAAAKATHSRRSGA